MVSPLVWASRDFENMFLMSFHFEIPNTFWLKLLSDPSPKEIWGDDHGLTAAEDAAWQEAQDAAWQEAEEDQEVDEEEVDEAQEAQDAELLEEEMEEAEEEAEEEAANAEEEVEEAEEGEEEAEEEEEEYTMLTAAKIQMLGAASTQEVDVVDVEEVELTRAKRMPQSKRLQIAAEAVRNASAAIAAERKRTRTDELWGRKDRDRPIEALWTERAAQISRATVQ